MKNNNKNNNNKVSDQYWLHRSCSSEGREIGNRNCRRSQKRMRWAPRSHRHPQVRRKRSRLKKWNRNRVRNSGDIGLQNQQKNTFLIFSPATVSQKNAHLRSVHRTHIPRESPSRNSGTRSCTSLVRRASVGAWESQIEPLAPMSGDLMRDYATAALESLRKVAGIYRGSTDLHQWIRFRALKYHNSRFTCIEWDQDNQDQGKLSEGCRQPIVFSTSEESRNVSSVPGSSLSLEGVYSNK